MKPSYLNLCTTFYDLTKPEAGPREIAFYETLLKKVKGPILEAMCGSGRLLIPLLKKGLIIEGVDNSAPMLKSCKERSKAQNLSPTLYHQSLEEIHLPKKYALIFIAIGSFQLIHETEKALQVLKNLQAALLPEGKLVIETFIPWDAIKDHIQGASLAKESRSLFFEKTVKDRDHSQITHKSEVILYFNEQVEKTVSRYEKWAGGQLVLSEEEEYNVRWYHRFEMPLFLEKAGFSQVAVYDASFEQNEQAIIYEYTTSSSKAFSNK